VTFLRTGLRLNIQKIVFFRQTDSSPNVSACGNGHFRKFIMVQSQVPSNAYYKERAYIAEDGGGVEGDEGDEGQDEGPVSQNSEEYEESDEGYVCRIRYIYYKLQHF
jgi:hypothetical protein